MNSLPYSCALNDRSFSGNEAGVEFFYIQTSVLFTCKYKIVSGKTTGRSFEGDSHPNRASLPLGPLTIAVNTLLLFFFPVVWFI